MGRLTTTFMRAYGISCGGVTRCTPAAPTASVSKRCSASWEYCNSAESRGSLVRESAVKPVGKPDALIGHVRFDERGWETGRRSGVSARAHPRLYPLASIRPADSLQGEANAVSQPLSDITAQLLVCPTTLDGPTRSRRIYNSTYLLGCRPGPARKPCRAAQGVGVEQFAVEHDQARLSQFADAH